jgi:hypothetical protein
METKKCRAAVGTADAADINLAVCKWDIPNTICGDDTAKVNLAIHIAGRWFHGDRP